MPSQKRHLTSGVSANAVKEAMFNKRTAIKTKKQYDSKIKTLIQYITQEGLSATALHEDGTLKLPIARGVLLDFFGCLCADGFQRDQLDGPEDVSEGSPDPYSISHIRGHRSAIVDLYTQANINLEETVSVEINNILDGYEKTINSCKLKGLMKITEGKNHLQYNGYSLLANKLFCSFPSTHRGGNWSHSLFAWPFLVLQWNLISRSESVETLMYTHIKWEGDCVTIEEQGHKGDQTGEKKFGKHVYANPYIPHICPVLALAVLIFTSGNRPEDGSRQRLFSGTNSKGRFGDILREMLKNLSEDEMVTLGCHPAQIGTHSTRKGCSTFLIGQVAGPNPCSVYLRMGHSLGKLKDAYIFEADGADQLCGRMASGLPFSDERFSTLPYHFDSSTLPWFTNAFWNSIVPGYNHYPLGFQSVIPFLLAALVYHEQYLKTTLRSNHPLLLSPVFTRNELLAQLR